MKKKSMSLLSQAFPTLLRGFDRSGHIDGKNAFHPLFLFHLSFQNLK